MEKLLKSMLAAAVLFAPTALAENLTLEAKQQVMGFAKELKGVLQASVKHGGFEQAVQVCNLQAPEIAARHSAGDWQVRRTSLKLRNPDNRPDAWELSVLQSFEERLAAGEAVGGLVASKREQGEYRFMKAIPTGKLCLACHGSNIAPNLKSEIDALYPSDRAVGFAVGDIRGAFSLRKASP